MKSPLSLAAHEAARQKTREILQAAIEEHEGDLDKVAADPRVGCDRSNLHHYGRRAGLDVYALAASARRKAG